MKCHRDSYSWLGSFTLFEIRRCAIGQEIHVRTGELRDAQFLTQFNINMARETEGLELESHVVSSGVKWLLNNPEYGYYLVAETEGSVVGSLMVTTEWSDWRDGIFWWIQSVYVSPSFRRRGIYRRLYEHVKALTAEQGNVCGFRLYVERDNIAAQKTYMSLGMREKNMKMFEEMVE